MSMAMRVRHIESPWNIERTHHVRRSGWYSVKDLQEAEFRKTWHPPKTWPDWPGASPERATPTPDGVLIERFKPDAGVWYPIVQLTLEGERNGN